MTDVEIRLLGPLEIAVSGRPVEVRRQKQRALLALLALRAGEVVPTHRIVDELWGDEPPKAAVGSLQNFVSELRKVLGAEVLLTRAPGYLIDVPRDAVDAHRFEQLTREARDAPPAERAERLREALALWCGPALADISLGESWAAEAARLEELRLAAWEDRLEADIEAGHHAAAVGELESLVAKHPLRERPVGLLMLALYRSGRQAEALEAYRRSRETLVDELGIEPSPELQRLEQAILRQDAALDRPEAPRERVPVAEPDRRKTVTIVFADLVDSTELGARLDPEVIRGVLDRYFELVRAAVERHGGVVEKFIGDGAMAVFGIPTLHEDDALRAVRAASELRESLGELSAGFAADHGLPLQARVGVNTGEVFVRGTNSGESFVTGPPVNIAMRLEQAAVPGEILLGEQTYSLVRHAVEAEPVDPVDLGAALGRASAFRLGGVGDAVRPLGQAALVGRTGELAWLQAAYAGVQAERRSRVVTVLGDAGVGKSRLARELAATTGEKPLVGRCISYGEGATFLPLDQIVRQAVPERPRTAILALLEGDDQAPLIAERVTHLTQHADGAASTGEVFWAVRRFLEALARRQPLVVVLEDIHWAEPTLLDLVEYLDSWPAEAPLLVLCLARRELLDERPGWGSRNGVLRLEPLGEGEAGELVDEVGAEGLAEEARTQIVELAAGNPLFLEQLLAFAGEAGAGALESVPPTVEALLASRLERLPAGERALLERAAVAGRDFTRGALLTLSPPQDLAALDRWLTALVRRGLVRALRGGDEDSFRFHHVLVRDVAYAGITKEARADLHERYGSWLEQRDGPDEIVGYHLEQAHRFQSELRPGDATLPALAQRAGARLGAAGVRAFRRADGAATLNLLERSTSLLAESEERDRLLCELGVAQWWAGEGERARSSLEEASASARARGDHRVELRARLELAQLRLSTDRTFDHDEVVQLVREARTVFEEAGDERGLARAWRILGFVRGSMQGHHAEWVEAAEVALVYYRRSGWSPAGCLLDLCAALYHGPVPTDEAAGRCARLLDDAGGRVGRAQVLVYLGGFAGLALDFDEAFALLAEAEAIYRDVGDTYTFASNGGRIRGRLALLDGDLEESERTLREACAVLEGAGDEAAFAGATAELGQVLYATGRVDEADACSRRSETHAPAADVDAQVAWRSLRAKILATAGNHEAAEVLSREAVSIISQTDALTHRGDVLLDAAEVARLAGRLGDTRSLVAEALELYHRKGNAASARQAAAFLDAIPV
ncbi:MAG TPA: BTAD domain-containing putative transcriptional regulator [Gaiellaceae bacterium]|nr:BTAD domain-containing putative transcriptional regulator [Gaiellaceae bacterium]